MPLIDYVEALIDAGFDGFVRASIAAPERIKARTTDLR
jgi:hypothetical protein